MTPAADGGRVRGPVRALARSGRRAADGFLPMLATVAALPAALSRLSGHRWHSRGRVAARLTARAGLAALACLALVSFAAPAPAQTNNTATGAPTISGTARVGETLTASTAGITDTDGKPADDADYTYQWIRVDSGTGADISGATNSTYTLVGADEGNTVKVEVSFTDDAGNSEGPLTSVETGTISAAPVNAPPTASNGSVTTDEDTAYTFEADDFNFTDTDSGDMLSGVEVVMLPSAGTLRLNTTPVTANQDVAASDIGNLVFTPAANANGTGYASFTFKVSDGTDKSVSAYTMTVNVTAVNDAATGAPTISGTAQVGETLTAATTDIADADGLPASFSYRWVRVDNGTDADISGATNSTYTLVGADEGNTVKVEVSFTDDAGNSEGPLTSVETGTISAAPVNAPPTASNGSVTTDEDTAYTFEADDFNFTDTDSGDMLSGVEVVMLPSAGTLRLNTTPVTANQDVAASDIGNLVFTPAANANGTGYASFTFKVSDGTDKSVSAYTMTVNVTAVNDAATGAPTISGTAQVGETLTAATTDIADADGLPASFSYQWIRVDSGTDADISGATNSTYTLVGADEGNTVKVEVSFTDDAGNSEGPLTSVETGTISAAPVNAPPTASNGSVTTDEDTAYTFEADDFNFTDTDSGDMLSGVEVVMLPSAGTLRLNTTPVTANQDVAASDIGNLVFAPAANANGTGYASFTFKVSDGTDKSVSAYTMTVDVTAVNDAATGAPTISGTAQVGETLTASIADIADADGLPASFGYQWVRVDNGTDADISGATDRTYTLVGADEGNTVKVEVSFTDDAGTEEGPLTSAETETIEAAPVNTAPEFPDATLTREIAENSAPNVNIGDVIPEATDADIGATLEYSMEGADAASFNFDVNSRQISTKDGVTYDRETKDSYSVTIKVTDGTESDTVAVTINVTNVIELPSAPTGLEVSPTLGAGGSLDASWTAPINTDKPAIAGYNLQYGLSSTGPWSNGPQGVAGTSAKITGLTGNTRYYVRVQASNVDGDGGWSGTDDAFTKIATNSSNCPAPSLTGRAQIWSATLTVGSGQINNLITYNGFNSVSGDHDVFGALSDTSFEIGINSYTVRTLATIPTNNDALFFSLNSFLADTEKAELTLHVCNSAFTLSSGGQVDGLGFKAYRWAYGVDWSDYATRRVYLSVPSANNPPDFSDTTLTRSIAENTAANVDIGAVIPAATDADTGDTLTYSMEGTDEASFNFDVDSRQISTKADVTYDFEATPSYSVTIRVSDGTHSDTVAVTISLTDVAERPDAPVAPTVEATSGSATSLDVSWTEPANTGKPEIASYDLQYRIAGMVDFTAGPENVMGTSKAIIDLTPDTEYEVQVRAVNADGDGTWSDSGTGRTNIVIVNTPPTAANGSVTTDEDMAHTFEAANFNFSDTDSADMLALVEVVTLPLAGTLRLDGTAVTLNQDVTKSGIDDGDLVFTPAANANGTGYASFTFKVSDGTDKSALAYTMTVNVTAVNDAATGLPATSGTAQVGETLTASTSGIEDVDGLTNVGYAYQWVRVISGTDSDISGATNSTYTLVAEDEGNTVKVKVSFTDDGGTSEELTSAATGEVAPLPNTAPDFSDTTLTREVAENTPADTDIGDVIPAAADANLDDLVYSMEGADEASFAFDASTRQIKTKAALDFETKTSYSVTIKADDSNGGTDIVDVTITVTNVVELPDVPAAPMVVPTTGSFSRLTVSWTAPANTGKPAITRYDLQYRAGNSGPFTEGPQGVEATTSNIIGLTPSTYYEVQVSAVNAEGVSGWSTAGMATTSVRPPISQAATKVVSTWSLKPDAIGVRSKFRLLFVSDTRRNLFSTNLGTYDTLVRNDASTGHDDIRRYSSGFRVIACSASVSAITNTGTPTSDSSVPIYWLDGAKVADNYADLYDGSWDSNAPKFPDGSNAGNPFVWHGCRSNGEIHPDSHIGVSSGQITAGRPGNSGSELGGTTGASNQSRRFYGLSGVFQVLEHVNNAPEFGSSSQERSFDENTPADTAVGIEISAATDADDDTLIYTMEGADAASFNFDASTRQISTKAGETYDFETKPLYSVTIKVDDDNGGIVTTEVTINVRDVDEPPDAPAAPSVDATVGSATSLDVSWTAPTNTGRPEITTYDLQYRVNGTPGWTNGPQNVSGTSSTITDLTLNTNYDVQVLARNEEGDSGWSEAGTGSTVNMAPEFSSETATRSLAENSIANTNVGAPVEATDTENDTLIYTLEGTDGGSFGIDETSGQIATSAGVHYDFEAGKSYSVIVKADDGNSGTDTIAVTIELTNVDEPPDAPGAPTVAPTTGSTTTSLDVEWTAPGNEGRTAIAHYDLQYRVVGEAGWTAGPQEEPGTTASIARLTAHTDYEVQVSATNEEGDSDWSVAGEGSTENTLPDFTDAALDREVAENTPADTAIGAAIPAATDADGDTLIYSLGGADAASFAFDAATRQLSTLAALNFEDNVSYTVTITADDDNGGTDTVEVTITVTDVAEPPDAPAAPSVAATPGSTTSLDVGWTVPGNEGRPVITGYDVQFRVGDSGPWTVGSLDVSGTTATILDVTPNTDYEVQVLARNEEGDSGWSPSGTGNTGNTAPVFGVETATRSVAENTPADVAIGAAFPAATDADGDTLIYSLEGPDAASFAFDAATRQLSTLAALDHEDQDSYSVTVRADDSNGGADTIAVTISLTDVDEPPNAPAAPLVTATAGSTTSLSVSWTAPGNTGRPVIESYDLQYRVVGEAGWTAGPREVTGTSSAIIGLTPDTGYEVQVLARNEDGEGGWSGAGSGSTGTPVNSAPAFPNDTLTRGVAENTVPETNIGAVIPVATDADIGDTLTYSLEGADAASFAFDESTRQIRTLAALDFEDRDSYSVTVRVADGNGGTDTVEVTINVTDADEPPSTPAAPSVSATAGETTSLDVEWTVPDNEGRPEISGYDLRYRVGNSSDWTDGPQDVTETNATITDVTPNTDYQVQVRASNDEGDGDWSAASTGNTGNIAPTFDVETATRSIAENTAAETDIGDALPEATDADALIYTLEGTDAASFAFDAATRQLSTLAGVTYDHESTDSYTVTLRADDSNGGADTIEVTITVTDEDEPPDAPAAPAVAATAGSTTRLDVEWTAPDNAGRPGIKSYDLQYRVVGDAGWTAGPREVMGTSSAIMGLTAGTDYEVQVLARNDEGDSGWSEAGTGSTGTTANSAPVFPNDTLTRGFAENTAADTSIGAVIPEATDADSGDTLTYSLEGADAASFAFDATTRQLRTVAGVSYDHEDQDSYAVTVRVDDSEGGSDTIAVTINLTDVDEPPDAPAAPLVTATAGSTTSLSVSWTAPGNEGRPVIESYDLQYRVVGEAGWTAGPGEVMGTNTTIEDLSPDTGHEVQVLARNEEGDSGWSEAGTGRTGTTANSAPVFPNDTLTRGVAENTAAETNIGAVIPEATDADRGDTLTYSLEGADAASFAFDAATRQLRTVAGVGYDHEAQDSYAVTVRVDDSEGGSDTMAVTIEVTDVDEPPAAPAAPSVAATADSTTSLEVGWRVPGNEGRPVIESYDLQYRVVGEAGWTAGPGEVMGTNTTIEDLSPDTGYEVQVLARNEEGDSGWSEAGTGRTGAADNRAPEFVSATVRGTQLVLTFNEALDENSTPAADDFEVQVRSSGGGSRPRTVTGVRVSGATIVLTLSSAVLATDTVTVTYLSPDSETDPGIGDEADNQVPAFSTPEPVANDTPASNNAPAFSDTTLTRGVAENTAADANIGAPIPAATDADGDTLTYRLEGADAASFGFDASTRQVKTLAALDHETQSSYSVTIRVSDGNGGTDTVAVTIAVTNLTEQAPRPDTPRVGSVVGSDNRLHVSWREPDRNGGRAITGYEVRYRQGAGGEWREWAHRGTGTSTTITGLMEETPYQVQVRSLNGELQSEWSGAGTGTTGTPVVGELTQGWLTRFGRTASDNALRAIENRWGGERIANKASHLTLGDGRLNSLFHWGGNDRTDGIMTGEEPPFQPDNERFAATGPEGEYSGASGGTSGGRTGLATGSFSWGAVPVGRELPELRDVVLGSSFLYSSESGGGEPGGRGQWSLWGDVEGSRFDGREGGLSLDGEVVTGTVGVDVVRGGWFGGVALSYSEGEGWYGGGGAEEGRLSTELTSVHPFARYEANEGASFWSVLGYGMGEWALTPAGSGSVVSGDLTTKMAAVGGRGVLLEATKGFELAIRSDARATETTTDSSMALMGDSGLAYRVRLLLEGTHSRALASGGVLSLTLEAGVRYDGGDAENGGGVEVGGGLSYASGRFELQANARMLATHADEAYQEWGVGSSVRYRARGDGSGLSLRLGSAWGVTESGVQSLWTRPDASGLARDGMATDAAQRFETELGYGVAGGVLWYPYLGAQGAGGGMKRLRLGLKLSSESRFEAGLELSRRLAVPGEKPDNALMSHVSMRW